LRFIENKEFWYSYLQGGTREIFEDDFFAIAGSRQITLTDRIKETEDLQSESQFALVLQRKVARNG